MQDYTVLIFSCLHMTVTVDKKVSAFSSGSERKQATLLKKKGKKKNESSIDI